MSAKGIYAPVPALGRNKPARSLWHIGGITDVQSRRLRVAAATFALLGIVLAGCGTPGKASGSGNPPLLLGY